MGRHNGGKDGDHQSPSLRHFCRPLALSDQVRGLQEQQQECGREDLHRRSNHRHSWRRPHRSWIGRSGASILGPTIGQVLGGNNGFAAQGTQGCGKRRKRQANGQTRFFLPSGGSCTCGRKKRQAASPNKGKDEPTTKFFGNLLGGNDQNCGACCYSQGYNQGASNYNNQGQGFNHGSSNQAGRCQCDYSKTFTDQNGRTHGGCRRADESGRTWCYTTGWGNSGCGDLQSSRRFPNNPWSYRACSYNG